MRYKDGRKMKRRNMKKVKKMLYKNFYFKYLKRKHDYTSCYWCNRVIKKNANYCQWCSKPNLEK